MSTALLQTIGAIAAVIITALVAPWLTQRIKGKSDLETTEREEWRKERRERDQERLREIASFKLENRTLRDAYEDLEGRVNALQHTIDDCQAQINRQSAQLEARDREVFYLKSRVSELEAENRRLYREIDALRQGQPP